MSLPPIPLFFSPAAPASAGPALAPNRPRRATEAELRGALEMLDAVSQALSHRAGAFTERELLDIVPSHLAELYRLRIAFDRSRATSAVVPGAPLTPREGEVLDWVATGKTNRDIAAILGVSPRTVEKHLERIYEKLGVETRTAAAMRAIKGLRNAG